MILEKMKVTAESYLGPVKDAVITVPAYFNDGQRDATKKAAAICGLNVQRIVNEPTAAAIAYAFNLNLDSFVKIAVIDLGGGTFDVTILEAQNRTFYTMATSGDTELGGKDFTENLMRYCIQDIEKKHKVDISNNKPVIQRLRQKCNKAKWMLSANMEATVDDLPSSMTLIKICLTKLFHP